MLLALVAHAAPLILPPGEPTGAWSHAMSRAGLETAANAEGTWAALVSTPAGWRLEIHRDGAVRSVPVDPPTTDATRERIAVLAASLLRGVEGASLPALPALPPPPPRPSRRAPVAVVPAPVAPEPAEVAAPAPPPVDEPVVAAVDPAEILVDAVLLDDPTVPAGDPVLRPWLFAGGGVAWRRGCPAAPSARITAGVAYGPLALGGSAVWTSELDMSTLYPELGMTSLDGLGGVWLLPRVRGVALGGGALAGVSRRVWRDGPARTVEIPMPVAGAELVARIPLGPLEIAPTARLVTDLARSPLGVEGALTGGLAPTQLSLELSVGPRLSRR